MMRSVSPMKFANAFSNEVLPELVPPLMMMLQRLLTAACSRSCMAWFMLPSPTSSWGVIGSLRNFRIDTTGPSSANGSMIALSRPPSCRRASTMGVDSSSRRPSGARIRRTMRSKCGTVGEPGVRLFQHAAPRHKHFFRTIAQNVFNRGVEQQVFQRPQPHQILEQARRQSPAFRASLMGTRLLRMKASTSVSTNCCTVLRGLRISSWPSSSMRVSKCDCALCLMSRNCCDSANRPWCRRKNRRCWCAWWDLWLHRKRYFMGCAE